MGKNEMGKHKRVAREVEAAAGEYPLPIETLVDHRDEHSNRTGAREPVHVTTLAVELPLDDTVSGECHPPTPSSS